MEQRLVTVVIPKLWPRDEGVTLAQESLARQTYSPIQVLQILDNEARGANWARNQGWRQAQGEFLLFSDCDCQWEPNAIEILVGALDRDAKASYAYCAFKWTNEDSTGRTVGMGPFTAQTVRNGSVFSTMSLFRAANFPGFDEEIKRLPDWDLYLTLLERDGRLGVCVPRILFVTPARPGISHGGQEPISWQDAVDAVRRKHQR